MSTNKKFILLSSDCRVRNGILQARSDRSQIFVSYFGTTICTSFSRHLGGCPMIDNIIGNIRYILTRKLTIVIVLYTFIIRICSAPTLTSFFRDGIALTLIIIRILLRISGLTILDIIAGPLQIIIIIIFNHRIPILRIGRVIRIGLIGVTRIDAASNRYGSTLCGIICFNGIQRKRCTIETEGYITIQIDIAAVGRNRAVFGSFTIRMTKIRANRAGCCCGTAG